MRRPFPWLWILLLLGLLLFPTPAGRLLLDLVGGLTLALLLLPLLAGGAALIGWQLLRRRIRICSVCGASSLGSSVCPACGSALSQDIAGQDSAGSGASSQGSERDAAQVTINVEATPVNMDSSESSK
jgi:hypothetical protein